MIAKCFVMVIRENRKTDLSYRQSGYYLLLDLLKTISDIAWNIPIADYVGYPLLNSASTLGEIPSNCTGCLGLQLKAGGIFYPKLNVGGRPIANKYREGKMQRTLKRELKST